MDCGVGERIYNRAKEIFPICRSITGGGVRETIRILNSEICGGIGLTVHEIPTGTSVLDWTVPKEWQIDEAYIEDELGNRIVDMKECNLHVMGYSLPVDQWFDLNELRQHIFTQPDQPDVVPYVTSYYKERFGMCMSQSQLDSLMPGKYHMVIKSRLFEGSLTYADVLLKGKTDEEVLITSYICHPSMANDDCSGPALLVELINYVQSMGGHKYSYRFVLNPETIGAIAYLSENAEHLKKHVKAGIVLSCVGDDRGYSIVHSRNGDSFADRTLGNVLKYKNNYIEYSYLERGSDERQYNAPGVDLPVVCFCRSKFAEFPEYHTSADDMGLVNPIGFQGAYKTMTEWIDGIEANKIYKSAVLGEPQLGKRGLYPTLSQKDVYENVMAMTDFIAYCDGNRDLFEISDVINVPVKALVKIAEKLKENNLITASQESMEKHCIIGHNVLQAYVKNISGQLKSLRISAGDKLYVSSDVSQIIKAAQNETGFRNREQSEYLLHLLVDELKNMVTENGTLLFPMFNWDFCKGIPFDYNTTKSKVGVLNNFVHDNDPEFKRTRHPIYSFMVWGKDKDYLCALDNQEAFGEFSPFGFLDRNGGKQLALGVPMSGGITYCHYLEQLVKVPYRYQKFFLGKYIDEDGRAELRSYSQFVRGLDVSFKYVMSDDFFLKHNVISKKKINGWNASVVKFSEIRDPVINNLKRGADFMYEFENYDLQGYTCGDNSMYEVGALQGYDLIIREDC